MDSPLVAHNHGSSSAWDEIKSHVDAQKCLAELLHKLNENTPSCYWWKITGGEANNSISRLLDVDENKMKEILRRCDILYGPNDSFRVASFEFVMTHGCLDWSVYRPCGKIERYIKIGADASDGVEKPKNMYSAGGVLHLMPVVGRHTTVGVRTKQHRRIIEAILSWTNDPGNDDNNSQESDNTSNKKVSSYLQGLLDVFKLELLASGGKYNQRVERKLHRAAKIALKMAASELLEACLDRIGTIKETTIEPPGVLSNDLWTDSPLVVGQGGCTVDTLPSRVLFQTPRQTIITPQPAMDNIVDVDLDNDDVFIDPFITELREETILQNLLHKRIHEKQERAFKLEHKNGRKLVVVLPPDNQTSDSFVAEAKKTKWVEDLLHNNTMQEGMMKYLAKEKPKEYQRVGRQQRLNLNHNVLSTSQTVAMARLSGLNHAQLKTIRSFLQHIGGVNLKFAAKDLTTIDKQVGLTDAEPFVQYGACTYEWAVSNSKGKEKRPPEVCNYWHANMFKEIEAEIDIFLQQQMNTRVASVVPTIDYNAAGFSRPGVVVIIGGDHGDKACPISLKMNLVAPQIRKQRRELNLHCPTIQVASVDCSKDTLELLQNTVMPSIRSQLIQLQQSSVVVVYNCRNPYEFKSYCVVKGMALASIQFATMNRNTADESHTMTYQSGGGYNNVVNMTSYFKNVPLYDLRVKVVVSNFHDLYVGDLAFQAMLVGMNHSSGDHCLLCRYKAAEFNCEPHHTREEATIRSKESLSECLNEFNRLRLAGKNVANFQGVNTVGLLDVDPQRLIVPILHCPMGLVDKVLQSFKAWVNVDVESLNDEQAEQMRQQYLNAQEIAKEANTTLLVAKANREQNNNLETRTALKAATTAKSVARKALIAAKGIYDECMQRHNARSGSLAQQFEIVFRNFNIRKEHYHGGKYNGVNCIRIMEKSQQLFIGGNDHTGFDDLIKSRKKPTVTDAAIDAQCQRYARLLGLLDAVWSNVRGVESGIAPTPDQINTLARALEQCKALWNEMDLTTQQPKWHLTFDGHLLHQVKTYGGLADKADDVIELQHQILKKQRERFRSVPTFMKRERCIRRELRRKRSPLIQSHVNKYEAKVNRGKGKRGPTAAQETKREAKRVKRDDIVNSAA